MEVERVKVLSLWRIGDREMRKSTMFGRLEVKKKKVTLYLYKSEKF